MNATATIVGQCGSYEVCARSCKHNHDKKCMNHQQSVQEFPAMEARTLSNLRKNHQQACRKHRAQCKYLRPCIGQFLDRRTRDRHDKRCKTLCMLLSASNYHYYLLLCSTFFISRSRQLQVLASTCPRVVLRGEAGGSKKAGIVDLMVKWPGNVRVHCTRDIPRLISPMSL